MNAVLDTNVVIDWLVFDDPYMNPLREGVRNQRITILTHPPALTELLRVLNYPVLKLNAVRQREVFDFYQAYTSPVPLAEGVPKGFPRCRDADDNHFLELAWHAGADVLVSRDKAVLKLRKRSGRFGFRILTVQELIGLALQLSE